MDKRKLLICVLILCISIVMVPCTANAATTKTSTTKANKFVDLVPKVSVSVVDDANVVTWKAVKGAVGYRVYRKESKDAKYKRIKTIKKATTLKYKDVKAPSGAKCYYKVRAYQGLIFKTLSKPSKTKIVKAPLRVYVACGHGTDSLGHWDTGTTYKGMTEAGLMLPITKAAVKYLRDAGIWVYTDADTGNDMNMLACVAFANKKDISCYVSVHCDWYKAVSGTYPLYVSGEGQKLAQAMNDRVLSSLKMPTRGLKKRYDLFELNMTDAPACIFETGSIRYDNKIFRNKYNKYGYALAQGIKDYLGVE